MSPTYAKRTVVGTMRSVEEIDKTLTRYGASGFLYGRDMDLNPPMAFVQFKLNNRVFKMSLALPDPNDPEFSETPTGKERSEAVQMKEWEQAIRQRYRALSLFIKATLEAVECGILTFDEAMLPYILMPDGHTVADHVLPEIDQMISGGQLPKALTGKGI